MDSFDEKMTLVIDVLLSGSLKKNMDDALLSKLLELLESNFKNNNKAISGPVRLLEKTDFLQLFEDNLKHMLEVEHSSFNANIVNFSIRALGIFLAHEDAFNFAVESKIILPLLENVCQKDFPRNLLLHSALLSCLLKLSEHQHGLQWIITMRGTIVKIFESSTSSSYYIRNDAESILCNVLIYTCSDEVIKDPTMSKLLEDLLELHIYPGFLLFSSNSFTETFCLSLLRKSMKKSICVRSLLLNKYSLLNEIISSLRITTQQSKITEDFIWLFVDCYVYSLKDQSKALALRNMVDHFMNKRFITSALILMTSAIIRLSEENICNTMMNDLNFSEYFLASLQPLFMISSEINAQISIDKYSKHFSEMTSNITEWTDIVLTALISLKQIAHYLPHHVHNAIIAVLSDALSKNFEDSPWKQVFECQRIKRTLLQSLSSLIKCSYFKQLEKSLLQKLLNGLLCSLDKEKNAHVSSVTLIIIKEFVQTVDIDVCRTEEFFKMIQKIQTGLDDPILDTSLEILYEILTRCQDHHTSWLDLLCCKTIYWSVYNWAILSSAMNYFRHTAIKALSEFYSNNSLWTKLLSSNIVSLDVYMNDFINLASSKILCVQSASVLAFANWIKISRFQSTSYYSMALKVLAIIIHKSEYDESKIIALSAYQYLNETTVDLVSSPDPKLSVQNVLLGLSENGYIHSARFALHDFFTSVKIKALQTLLHLRKKLISIGIKQEDYAIINVLPINDCNRCYKSQTNHHIQKERLCSRDEINAGIEFVVNQYTVDMIDNLATSESPDIMKLDDPSIVGEVKSCCKQRFWRLLWSEELESLLTLYSQSSDIYVKNPVALLEDIIASKEVRVYNTCDDRISECLALDCY